MTRLWQQKDIAYVLVRRYAGPCIGFGKTGLKNGSGENVENGSSMIGICQEKNTRFLCTPETVLEGLRLGGVAGPDIHWRERRQKRAGVHLASERSTTRHNLPPGTDTLRFDSIAVVNRFNVGAYCSGCCCLSLTPRTRSSCDCAPFNQWSSGASTFSPSEIRSCTSGVSGIKRISAANRLVIQGGSGICSA